MDQLRLCKSNLYQHQLFWKTQQDQLLVELASFNYSSGEGGSEVGGEGREWQGGEESGMGEEESGVDGEGSGINGDWLGEGGGGTCYVTYEHICETWHSLWRNPNNGNHTSWW